MILFSSCISIELIDSLNVSDFLVVEISMSPTQNSGGVCASVRFVIVRWIYGTAITAVYGIRTGQDQLMKLAVDLDLNLDGPGRYFIIGNVNGQTSTRMMFQVVPGPLLASTGGGGSPPSTGR